MQVRLISHKIMDSSLPSPEVGNIHKQDSMIISKWLNIIIQRQLRLGL